MMKVVNLCGEKGCCPRVEIYEDEVKIGEEGNFCVLKKEQWKSLVEKIKAGELQ
jgi:hypothetical protein